jgi:predicted murein hydrolase (TIGR00659 family)
MESIATAATLTGLIEKPPIAISMTLAAYLSAQMLQARFPKIPLLNPTLVAIILIAAFIEISGSTYPAYLHGAQYIGFLIAPTVVVLAVPLYRRLDLVKTSWPVIAGALCVGLPMGVLSSIGIMRLCGARWETLLSLAPRSVTAGIAMGISQSISGIPALTAVLAIMTGITGAVLGPWLLQALKIKDERIIGLALGITSHGIGTARAFQISDLAGAFSSLAMSLNGIGAAVLIPMGFALLA